MMQSKSSISLGNCKAIGAGKVLAYLRGDLQQAKENVLVVGPWLDGFFVREIASYLKKSVAVRCLVRIEAQEELISEVTYQALQELKIQFPGMEARSLSVLHAKVILIDDRVAYLGSTNWYKYSLEQAQEVTIRAALSDIKDLSNIVDEYWGSAKVIDLSADGKKREVQSGGTECQGRLHMTKSLSQTAKNRTPEINYDVLDPLARKVLQANPKAFVKRRK